MNSSSPKHTINEIINHFGNKAKLARLLNITPQSLTRWSDAGIPPHAAIKIERATDGLFKAVDIPINDRNIRERQIQTTAS